MDKDFTSTPRPTFKRTLRRNSMISVIITMTLIWLLLCFASVVTLKQYAQKNLELTGATMSHSLEASLVFNDSLAANETLAALGKQGQFAVAEVINVHKKRFAYWSWNPKDNNDTLGALVSRWLFPVPIAQPIMHNGSMIGEIRLTARDSLISHFIWMSFAVLTGCILFATVVAIAITHSLHHGM
ncbi:GGDEF domain-containing protein, partial [Enterobacter kobei]|nr:GGDEF domain-containing protein [Enterobacter kobei]